MEGWFSSHRIPTRKEKKGRAWRTLVDADLLALALGQEAPPEPRPGGQGEPPRPALEAHLPRIAAEARDLPRGLKWDLIKEEARNIGVTPGYLARLLRRYEGGQPHARRPRRDRGTHRVPAELRKLVVGLKLAHPRASARRILRILEANDPGLLVYRPYSTETLFRLSEATVRRILRRAEEIPAFRYALLSEEGRREFARTWAGHVLAEYPMQMVMVDMTRCDTFVYLPEEDRMVRLRIHVALDVYSGAVPSLVFSREEGQVPTDQLLILMTQDKTAIVPDWDVRGVPERIYWDNGKVYRSEKSEHWARTLGIELVYSRPHVSHTRGRVERFFGAFHQTFEALLPGYAGQDATERDSSELRRLLQNTRRWVAEGMPPSGTRTSTASSWRRSTGVAPSSGSSAPGTGSPWGTDSPAWTSSGPSSPAPPRGLPPGGPVPGRGLPGGAGGAGNGTVQYRGRTWYLDPRHGSLPPWQGQRVVVLDVQVPPRPAPPGGPQEPGRHLEGPRGAPPRASAGGQPRGPRQAGCGQGGRPRPAGGGQAPGGGAFPGHAAGGHAGAPLRPRPPAPAGAHHPPGPGASRPFPGGDRPRGGGAGGGAGGRPGLGPHRPGGAVAQGAWPSPPGRGGKEVARGQEGERRPVHGPH